MATQAPLAWEARYRPRAAAASALAAIFILGSFLIPGFVFADRPSAPLLDTLRNAAQPGAVGDSRSLRIAGLQFFSDHVASLLLTSLMRGIGYVLIGLVLTFLIVAARSRMPEIPKLIVRLPMIGGVLSGAATVVSSVGTAIAVNGFLAGSRTVQAAADIAREPLIVTAGLINVPGLLALGGGLAVVCLNAMRVGLLTRFMGVLGMLSGALFVLPLGSPLPVVQSFWLLALAVLLAGRWPGGEPSTWQTGVASPWPTQQELREAREAAGVGKVQRTTRTTRPTKSVARPAADHPAADHPDAAHPDAARDGGPHPSLGKKKRKRRA